MQASKVREPCSCLYLSTRTESPSDIITDGCDTSDCYSQCGTSMFVEQFTVSDSHVVIRQMHFDLKDLTTKLAQSDIPVDSITRVSIYAQTVVQTSDISVGWYKIMIYSRQFISTGHGIKHPGDSTHFDFSSMCVVDFKHSDCRQTSSMKLISREGYLDLYTQQLAGIENPCAGRKGRALDDSELRIDEIFLKMSLGCSAILTMENEPSGLKLANNINSFVNLHLGTSSSLDGVMIEILRAISSSLTNEISLKKSGKRWVPFVSISEMGKIIESQSDIVNAFQQSYDSAVTLAYLEGELTVIVGQKQALLEVETLKHIDAKSALKSSTDALEMLREGFTNSKYAVLVAENKFRKGIKQYKKKSVISQVFKVFSVIGGFLADAFGRKRRNAEDNFHVFLSPSIVKQNISSVEYSNFAVERRIKETKFAKTAQEVSVITNERGQKRVKRFAVLTIVSTIIAVIGAAIKLIAEIVPIILSIIELSETLGKAQSQLGIGQNLDTDVTFLRTHIVEFKNVRDQTAAFLGAPPLNEIDGSADYRYAVSEMANWGEELTKQTIEHAELIRRVEISSAEKELTEKHHANLQNLLEDHFGDGNRMSALLNGIKEAAFDVQFELLNQIIDYCSTFFFYSFQDCDKLLTIRWSDTLGTMFQKVKKIAQEESYVNFLPTPPTAKKSVFVLQDKNETCEASLLSNSCPVTTLRQFKEAIFNIPLSADSFGGLDRVRIAEIRLYLVGANFKGDNQVR